MAVRPNTLYSGQVDADATNYPFGKARNESVSGANNGTPLEKNWVNDLWGFFAALLGSAGITPSDSPETAVASQYLQAIQALITGQSHRIIGLNNPYGSPISDSFTATSGSPYVIANGSFSVGAVALGNVLIAEFFPVFVDNTASSSDCHILVQYQNGGSWTTAADYLVPQSTSRSFSPRLPQLGLSAGTCNVRLAGYNSSVSNALIRSVEQSSYLAQWMLLNN